MAAAAATVGANAAPAEEIEETAQGAEAAEGAPGKKRKFKLSRKKLIILGGVLLILVAGGGGAVVMGLPGALLGGGEASEEAAPEESIGVFFDLPEMLVNLSTNGKKLGFLKLRVALELKDADATAKVEAVLPRIIDTFQTYLRGLRMEDLNGSAGLYRLREELLLRVSAAVKPVEVKDVLFKEMLVQ